MTVLSLEKIAATSYRSCSENITVYPARRRLRHWCAWVGFAFALEVRLAEAETAGLDDDTAAAALAATPPVCFATASTSESSMW